MKRNIVAAAATFALAAAILPALPVCAQSAPATQRVLSRGLLSRPDAGPLSIPRGATHVVFGRLESVSGKMLTLRTRSGHLWNVNAAAALASGNYSAPLFVGKVVEVEASLDRLGVLQARGIMRMGSLDRWTPADR